MPPPESTVEMVFSSGTAERTLLLTFVTAEMPEGREETIRAMARMTQSSVIHFAPLPLRTWVSSSSSSGMRGGISVFLSFFIA